MKRIDCILNPKYNTDRAKNDIIRDCCVMSFGFEGECENEGYGDCEKCWNKEIKEKLEIYVVFLDDKPLKTSDGKIYFDNIQKAINYKNNAIRQVGRELYCKAHLSCKQTEYNNWYEIGEENKQEWFDMAEDRLDIKTFIIKEKQV